MVPFTRKKPTRAPLSADLPWHRVVVPAPESCACCHGVELRKIGETITESREVVPRQWIVVQTVREKFICKACETITQPPAPFHPVPRASAGPNLLVPDLLRSCSTSSGCISRSTARARPMPPKA
jgi:transposase